MDKPVKNSQVFKIIKVFVKVFGLGAVLVKSPNVGPGFALVLFEEGNSLSWSSVSVSLELDRKPDTGLGISKKRNTPLKKRGGIK